MFLFRVQHYLEELERFNGRMSEFVQQPRFTSAAELKKTLYAYLKVYNHHYSAKGFKASNADTDLENLATKQA